MSTRSTPIGTLDLTAEPIVLTVPDTGDRWWLMQIVDAWNDVPAAPTTAKVGGSSEPTSECPV